MRNALVLGIHVFAVVRNPDSITVSSPNADAADTGESPAITVDRLTQNTDIVISAHSPV